MKNDAIKLPNLPGMRFDDPEKNNFQKKQNFGYNANIMIEKCNPNMINEQEQKLIQSLKSQLGETNIKTFVNNMSINRVNDNDNFDDEVNDEQAIKPNVLSFKGYFEEAAVQSALENIVMRKVVIKYYLDDHTIEIVEPKVKNSGMPQGKFLKRQRVPKNLNYNEFISFNDFEVGSFVVIFNREIKIYAINNFTREFYKANGTEQPESFESPKDDYTKTIEKKTVKLNDPDLNEYKQYSEVRLGGGNFNDGLDKYLKNDGKVLIFDVVWSDETYAGGLNFYKLHYHLSDDKIEIKEINEANNGKTPFPLFLKRLRLPKQLKMSHVPGMIPKNTEYYEAQDLVLGSNVKIYNREFLIINCDQFTKDYFKDNFNLDQVKIEGYSRDKKNTKKVDIKVPPHNGFGSEEDSLSNCYNLIPKPPRIDMAKMFMYDKITLRFICRIMNDEFDLPDRKLIMSFYCGDDSFMLNLLTGKNSGIINGKFLERKKYKNDLTGTFLKPEDLFIGQIFSINKHQLQIIQGDNFSLQYMEAMTDVFGSHTRSAIVEKLKNQMAAFETACNFKVQFNNSNKQNKGEKIKVEQLLEVMKSINAVNSYEQLYYLLNMAKMVNSNFINIEDFLNVVKKEFYP